MSRINNQILIRLACHAIHLMIDISSRIIIAGDQRLRQSALIGVVLIHTPADCGQIPDALIILSKQAGAHRAACKPESESDHSYYTDNESDEPDPGKTRLAQSS